MTPATRRIAPLSASILATLALASASWAQAPAGPAVKGSSSTGGDKRPGADDGPMGDTTRFTRMGGWGGMGGFATFAGMSRMMLVMNPAVQRELRLTPAQAKAVLEGMNQFQKRTESMLPKPAQPSAPGAADPAAPAGEVPAEVDPAAMLETAMVLVSEGEAGPARVLSRKQLARLDQIVMQMEGVACVRRPEVASAIGLNPGQVDAVQEILNETKQKQARLLVQQGQAMIDHGAKPDASPDSDATKPEAAPASTKDAAGKTGDDPAEVNRRKRADDVRKLRRGNDEIQVDTTSRILRHLTKRQRDRLDKLMGEPFDPARMNDKAPPGSDPAATKDEPKPPAGATDRPSRKDTAGPR